MDNNASFRPYSEVLTKHSFGKNRSLCKSRLSQNDPKKHFAFPKQNMSLECIVLNNGAIQTQEGVPMIMSATHEKSPSISKMSPVNQMAVNPHFFQPMPLTSAGQQVRHHPYIRTLGKFSSLLSQTQYKNIANVNAGFNHSVVGDSNAFEIDDGILKQLDMHNNDREKLHQLAIKLNQRHIKSMSLIKGRIQSNLEEMLKELKGFENFLNESKKITDLYESIKKYKVNDGHQMGVKMHQVYIKLCECIALQKSTGGSPSNFEQIKRLQSDYESFKIIFGTIYQQFQIIMNLSNRWQNQAYISESKIKMHIQFYGPIIKNQKELLEQIEKIESL